MPIRKISISININIGRSIRRDLGLYIFSYRQSSQLLRRHHYSNKSLFFLYRMKKPAVLPTTNLMACHVSRTFSKGLEFQKRLQKYSCFRGEMVRTKTIYAAYVKEWMFFQCTEQSYNSYNPHLKHVLSFLLSLYERNLGYSSISIGRSALSPFVIINNQPVAEHPLVIRYLKGVFQSRTALPKYSFTWDAGKVIKHLSKVDISKIKDLTLKLATLLALLCGQRAREILSAMDIRNTVMQVSI